MRLFYLTKTTLLTILSRRTIGVRALVIHENMVLLVKHTYQTGWYTIGGAVDPGETTGKAIERELYEEVGLIMNSPPQLFSIYYSRNERRDDYIVFYIHHGCTQKEVKSREIAEQKWFPLKELPPDASPATRKRIQEYLGESAISDVW